MENESVAVRHDFDSMYRNLAEKEQDLITTT